jgi:hypothetical protein
MSGTTSAIEADVVAAYLATHYHVAVDGADLVLRIGEPSAALDRLLAREGVDTAGVITAHNPRSRPTSAAENDAAAARLIARVTALGLGHALHVGRDPAGAWPAEEGLMVFGLDDATARRIGAEFDQNAYVRCRRGGTPELVLLR